MEIKKKKYEDLLFFAKQYANLYNKEKENFP